MRGVVMNRLKFYLFASLAGIMALGSNSFADTDTITEIEKSPHNSIKPGKPSTRNLTKNFNSIETRKTNHKNSMDISVDIKTWLNEIQKNLKDPDLNELLFTYFLTNLSKNPQSYGIREYLLNHPSFLQDFIDGTQDNIKLVNSQGLANTIYGLGWLEIPLHTSGFESWLTIFIKASEGKIQQFTPQELANTIYGLGKLEVPLNFPGFKTWLETYFVTAEGKLEQFDAQNLLLILRAFVALKIEPSKAFMNGWLNRAESQMDNLNAQDLSAILQTLGVLKIEPTRTFMDAWFERADSQTRNFYPRELSYSLWAMAKLHIVPNFFFMDAWLKRAISQLKYFNSQNLSSTIWALGILEIKPYKISNDMNPHIKYEFEKINNLYHKFIDGWFKKVESQLKDFKEQDFANSLYSMAVMNIPVPNSMKNRALELMREARDYRHIHQFYLASKWFDWDYTFTPNQIQAIKSYNHDLYSKFEEDVFNTLKRVFPKNQPLEQGVFIEEILSPVDIFVPQKKLVIQADGPYHYLLNDFLDGTSNFLLNDPTKLSSRGSFNGSTRFQTDLLTKNGYLIERIGYQKWFKMDVNEKKKWASDVMRKYGVSKN